MRTALCELLGIDQPIVQAPIAQSPRLAAAVSNAGALGHVALTWAADAGDVVHAPLELVAGRHGPVLGQ